MKETYYFSHDYHARHDIKLQSLSMEQIGIYWCLVEMLYEENGYIKLNLCERIANALRTQCDTVNSVIRDCDLFENDGVQFWSNSILRRLQIREEKSEKARNSAKVKWDKMRTQCDGNAIKERKGKEIKNNTVPNGTSITINGKVFMLEELTYEPLEEKRGKSKYGSATMAILARRYAELAGVELGKCFDASEWSKPLGSMYRYFGKDADKTMAYMEKAIKYFESKNLTYTPHTLARDKEMMDKWAGDEKKDISERRVL